VCTDRWRGALARYSGGRQEVGGERSGTARRDVVAVAVRRAVALTAATIPP
jgi:hypothetical protein